MGNVHENRLRRVAERQGLQLRKSRRRDENAHDFGVYWLVEPVDNLMIAGGDFGLSLDEVEAFLSDRQPRPRVRAKFPLNRCDAGHEIRQLKDVPLTSKVRCPIPNAKGDVCGLPLHRVDQD